MSTKQLLRGHRGRKARRYLKRHPESYVIGTMPTPQGKLGMVIFGPPTPEDYAAKRAELGLDIDRDTANAALATIGLKPLPKFDAAAEVKRVYDLPEHACQLCGATGDNPCVTSSGKRASKPHTGRIKL